jgi:hypothetical protein
MAAKSDPEKAQRRADILWEHHRKYGRVTIADVKVLVGIPCDGLYKTFEYNGVEAPPIWDSQSEKTRRKARLLVTEAERLGQGWLTKEQAGRVLGIKRCRVGDVVTQIMKRGFSAPKILDKSNGHFQAVEEAATLRMIGSVNPHQHPAGLQVMAWWEGPEVGEVTYLLR